MRSAIVKNIFTFRNYLILAIIAIALLTFLAKNYAFFSIDLYITRQIQLIQNPVIVGLLFFMTWLGNYYQAIFSLIIFTGALFIYGYKKESLILTLSTLGAVVIAETLKLVVSRPRPDSLLINQIEVFTRHDSFPSGHVLFYCGFYGCLLFLTHLKIKHKRVRNILMGILLAIILLVGISRIYLGSHWFSDVLAAYLIGSVWLYIVILIFRKIHIQSK